MIYKKNKPKRFFIFFFGRKILTKPAPTHKENVNENYTYEQEMKNTWIIFKNGEKYLIGV